MNLYWLKLNANFDKDDRILHLENQKNGEIATLCYVKLLCMAGRSNMGGGVYYRRNTAYGGNTFESMAKEPCRDPKSLGIAGKNKAYRYRGRDNLYIRLGVGTEC